MREAAATWRAMLAAVVTALTTVTSNLVSEFAPQVPRIIPVRRQTHAIYERDDGRFANAPTHLGDIPAGTLRNVLKTTGI